MAGVLVVAADPREGLAKGALAVDLLADEESEAAGATVVEAAHQ